MNKHICFIIPSIGVGGAEKVISILANSLVSGDYTVSIVCLVNNVEFPIDKKVRLVFPDFKIHRNFSTLFKVINYYRRTIRCIKPDVILSFLEFYNEITMLSLLGIKKSIYLFDRSNPFLKEQNAAQFFLHKVLYPKAKGVIVQTDRAAQFIKEKKLSRNVFVLPNPLTEKNEEWNPDINKIITCVGRMVLSKNQKYLIKIFSELPHEGWILQFVGDGKMRQELEDYAKELNLNDNVIFLGTRKDIQLLLSKSTIFAFPSLSEGFPNALIEAMAIGVPCISNNCDTGPSELIINGENGFLVEVDDKEDFKNKLSLLMTDSKLRENISQQCQKISHLYSPEIIGQKLIKFILKDD